jgi:hypothetical protein
VRLAIAEHGGYLWFITGVTAIVSESKVHHGVVKLLEFTAQLSSKSKMVPSETYASRCTVDTTRHRDQAASQSLSM